MPAAMTIWFRPTPFSRNVSMALLKALKIPKFPQPGHQVTGAAVVRSSRI
jgi:hypothetical protein